jgi:hypothetical protein
MTDEELRGPTQMQPLPWQVLVSLERGKTLTFLLSLQALRDSPSSLKTLTTGCRRNIKHHHSHLPQNSSKKQRLQASVARLLPSLGTTLCIQMSLKHLSIGMALCALRITCRTVLKAEPSMVVKTQTQVLRS